MFDIGQRVVCVDDSPSCLGDPSLVVKGLIYTIKDIVSKGRGVLLMEVPDPGRYYIGWKPERFRPIRDTDISVFADILEKINRKEKVGA